jgi:uncharacterized OB-fold protein
MSQREDDIFWEGAGQDRLMAQQCAACATIRHPPAAGCPRCGALDWNPRQLSGRGTIATWVVSKHPTKPDLEPRTIIVVELEEGVRVVSNLVDAENARMGARVAVEFHDVDGQKFPFFRTA